MKKLNLLTSLFLILFFLGCSQSYQMIKYGKKFEKNGLRKEAAEYYYKALCADRENIDALIGLKKTYVATVDEIVYLCNQSFFNENYNKYFETYNTLLDYQSKLFSVGITFQIPNDLQSKFLSSCDILAENHYQKGLKSFNNQEYDNAVNEFEAVKNYKTNYKETKTLLDQSRNENNKVKAEEFYQKGVAAFQSKKFKIAFNYFNSGLEQIPNYKDAVSYKQKSLENGIVRIGLSKFINSTSNNDADDIVHSYMLSTAVNYNSPFITIIDRENIDQLLAEQNRSFSGYFDQNNASQLGKLVGLDYIVIGEILHLNYFGGDIKTESYYAYEPHKVINSEGKKKTEYKKVIYKVHESSVKVTCEIQYQVISVETGQIIDTNIVSDAATDKVYYATYNGDYTLLTSATNNFDNFIDKLTPTDYSIFTARRNLKSTEELSQDILVNLGKRISNNVCQKFD